MTTYDEVLSFQQFDNNDAISSLVDMLPDKALTLNGLFKIACIQGHAKAVKFIYKEAAKQGVELDTHGAILLAIKNYHHDIIEYFISEKIDTSSKEVIKKALKYQNDLIIHALLTVNEYDSSTLQSIYDFALTDYSYKIAKEIESRAPELKLDLPVQEINRQLKELSQKYITLTSDQTDFVCDLVDKGGDISLLNASLILICLIADKEYESAAKLIRKGIDPTKITISEVLFMIDEYWMDKQEFKEKVLDEFQDYMRPSGINCMPECVSNKNYLKDD